MGTLNLEIQEENFIKKSTSFYDLSILIGMDRLSYMVYDDKRNVLVLKNYTFSATEEVNDPSSLKSFLQEVYIKDKLLKLPYNSVKIGIVNEYFTLIPEPFYAQGDEAHYFKNIVESTGQSTVFATNKINIANLRNVFAIDTEIEVATKSFFPEAVLFHIMTPLILGYQKIVEHQKGKHVFLNVRSNLMQICCFDNKELIFSNSFNFDNSKDFIYYVMLVFNQFKLKPESVPVTISGRIVEDSEIFRLLYRYIIHLNLTQTPNYFRFGKKCEDIPKHYYFDLYSVMLCE